MIEGVTRYFIQLSYKGTRYHGWQSQDNSNTVQSVIEHSLSILLSEKIEIVGAGRTDAGVHAIDYFAHFDTTLVFDLNDMVFKLNNFLPNDIAIKKIFPVPDNSHARFSALARAYIYQIIRKKNPFLNDSAYYVYGLIDVDDMNKAAAMLLEYTDFTSFSKVDTNTKTKECKIFYAKWKETEHLLTLEITANRFLRNMVRAIVGTLLEVGTKKIDINNFRKIIENKNRCDAGYSVPAKGLFLKEIKYPEEIFSKFTALQT